MSIFHDAYLFDPQAFADQVKEHIHTLNEEHPLAYSTLRCAGISALRTSANVQHLADTYGGWDETSVLEELPPNWSNDPHDHSFCLTLLLYNCIGATVSRPSLGLHTLWRSCDSLLERLGWDSVDRKLLVKGHDFGVFFDRYIAETLEAQVSTANIRSIFQWMHPASTGGSVGWLDLSDVSSLQHSLHAEQSRLQPASCEDGESDSYQKAHSMLDAAASNEKGLCLVFSG